MPGASRPPSWFARLDDRIVPVIQRASRRTAGVLGAPFRALERLEDRFAPGPVRVLLRLRQLLVLVAAVILFVGSYVHLQRFPGLRAAPSQGGAAATASSEDGDGTPDAGAVIVGPSVGADVAAYVRGRRDALAGADDGEERVAIVSFADYLTGEAAAAALAADGVSLLQVQIRVPGAEQQPVGVEVSGDLVATVRGAADAEGARLAEEEAGIKELLESGTIEEQDFEETYRADLDRLAAARARLEEGAGTVFAVVVRAPVAQLRAVGEREGVRLVDLAPVEANPARATFHGLLPEDRETVTVGALR